MTSSPAPLFSPRIENWLLVFAGLLYTLLYCLYWPATFTIMDEGAYMNMAYVLRHGSLYLDSVGISAPMSYSTGTHIVTQYPPGMPMLLALTSLLSWKFALGSNLLVHLCGFVIVATILRYLRLPVLVSVLYLLHPTAVIFSRTVMSDPASGVLTALAFLCLLRRQWLLMGVTLGVSVLIRTANGIMLPLAALGLFVEVWRERRASLRESFLPEVVLPVVWMGLGSLPLIASAYFYQAVIQQGGWAHYTSGGAWGPQYLREKLAFYGFALTVLYPGMIAAPLLYRERGKGVLLSLTFGTMLFYSCYYFSDTAGSAMETFVIGQRYVLTVLPLFIVAYAALLHRLLERLPAVRRNLLFATFLGASAVTLFMVTLGIHRKHASYLTGMAHIRDTVNRNAPSSASLFCNVHIGKLLHPAWGGVRRYTLLSSREAGSLQQLSAALTDNQTPVYLAVWSRDYRPETAGEQSILQAIQRKFHTVNLLSGEKSMIPGKLELLRVEGLRSPRM